MMSDEDHEVEDIPIEDSPVIITQENQSLIDFNDYSSPIPVTTSPSSEETKQEVNSNYENFENNENNSEDDPATNSYENLIPLNKLKNGWFTISSYFTAAVDVMKEKSIEAYNSETLSTMKRSSIENWEKTTEAMKPLLEQTKTAMNTAVEFTTEKAIQVVENVQPTLEVVSFFFSFE